MQDIHYGGGGANLSLEESVKTKKRYELFNTSYIQKIFNDVMNLSVISFEKPKSWGLPHVIYIVKFRSHRDLVLRANLGPDNPETALVVEKLITEKVAMAGIKANEIIHVNISRKKYPFDFQIQEKFEGLDPEIEFHGTQKDYDKISFQLGQMIAKMSSITFNGFGRFDEKLAGTKKNNYDYIITELDDQLKNIVDNHHLSFEQSDKIIKIFEESKDLINVKTGSLVHYDLADHNLRYNPVTFDLEVIFDWESAVSSDPFLDIGSCPTWKTLHEREEKLLEGYSSLKTLPDNYREKINIYRLRTMLWKLVHNIKFNILTPARFEKFKEALVPFHV
ncbi:MAG: hypothetical protein UR89_C0031G0003 [Candidatus Roizmanbacteria bacterium GW2011_GWA2_35_8]|uniref:Aminoglycoside phosphotransferase domain-containing protein n=1 Tax=Candidatus Roizmanbacteria bacterium GW2011_GWA2_35_8 TaxID=1618479 RepID=A0A0G0FFG6_9BACT|nr:MAG: hypothetical protein UR89_C0031G0003 [Candidatus Roizmanbacteria bacterium GW2011_GWA2_35_8]